MQQVTFTLDLSRLKPHQLKALMELVDSFEQPYVIPTSDENGLLEHDSGKPVEYKRVMEARREASLKKAEYTEPFDIQTAHGGRCW